VKTRLPDNPKTSMQFKRLSRCLIWVAAAALAGSCLGQVMQPPGTMPDGQRMRLPPPNATPHVPPPNATPHVPPPNAVPDSPQAGTPAAPAQPGSTLMGSPNAAPGPSMSPSRALPPSLGDKPAQPARVTLAGGQLSVDANNSSLSQILGDLSTTSGMTVDGLNKDSRVFGVYGPGDPRDILSELLDGVGYNFLLVGSTDAGTPREVVLTTRSTAPLSSPSPGVSSQPEEEDEPVVNNYPPEQMAPQAPLRTPGQPPDNNGQPKTPAEIIQELQRMRQQQQQQQPQSQSPQ
jgi:hypothetical protein